MNSLSLKYTPIYNNHDDLRSKVPAQFQDQGEWQRVASRSTRQNKGSPLESGPQKSSQTKKGAQEGFHCDESEATLESQGLLKAQAISY